MPSDYEITQMIAKKDAKADVTEAVTNLCNIVNGNQVREDALAELLVDAINRQHRTLQQGLWRTLIQVINLYGKNEYSDARNDDSVRICQEITFHIEAGRISGALPYI